MKKKVIAAILVVLMFIPTVVAAVNYSSMQGGEANIHNTVAVTVLDTVGSEYEFRNADGEKDMISYWLDTIAAAEKIGTLPTTVENLAFFQVTVSTAVSDTGYKFYLTSAAADCYFVNASGEAYKMSEESAAEFLKSSYAACLFENGIAPTLTISGATVSPDASQWSFKNGTGEYVKSDTSFAVKDEAEELTLEGGLTMAFNIKPDNLALKITDKDSGALLFDDVYDNIAALSVKENMKISVTAEAKWYEDAERTYYGEQTYKFDATVSAPAQFYVGTASLEVGEFVLVTGENVKNSENISFSSSPDIAYNPVFFADGDSVHTLIPFNYDLAAGEYTLTFSYGGATQQLKLTLKAPTNKFGARTVTIADAVMTSYGTDEVRTKCESTLSEIAKLSESTKLWNGSFLAGVDENKLCRGFGHTITISGTKTSFRHTGIDYSLAAGANVQAVNAGKVVYSGFLDYSGYTVVIEHGYGLKSWYCHMASATVKEGASVAKGDTIGTTGNSGLSIENGVHIGMTVFNVPVSQYPLWDSGVWKGIPEYGAN